MSIIHKLFKGKSQPIQEEIVTTLKESKETSDEYEIVEKEILPEKMVCPDCGGLTLVGLDFCDKCGGELTNYDNY